MVVQSWKVAGVVFCFGLAGSVACTDQHDPTGDWKKFKAERANANAEQPKLTENYEIPVQKSGDEPAGDPIEKKYASFCGTCHGANGDGKGPAGMGLQPVPRNFITWNDKSITDDYIAKVIREGGQAVGKSALMAPWGAVLSDDEITGMVAKVRSFRK